MPLLSARELHHALISPLTVLKMNLSSLQNDAASEMVEQCLRSVQYIEDQLGGLIHPQEARFDIAAALDEVVRLSSSSRHTVVSVVSAKWRTNSIFIKGSKVLFQQALQCLVHNALHAYTDRSGLAVIMLNLDSRHMYVSVCDMGRGMSFLELRAAQLPRVSWTKGGSGIGIPFAIDVIERHLHGDIHFLSQRGIGTMVKITIPRRW